MNLEEQECIPVGCVPSAAVAVPGGVCLPGGVSACQRVSAWQGRAGEGVCLPRGVCLPGGGRYLSVTLPLWTEWETRVKTLPCCNYVVDGKNWNVPKRKQWQRVYLTVKIWHVHGTKLEAKAKFFFGFCHFWLFSILLPLTLEVPARIESEQWGDSVTG